MSDDPNVYAVAFLVIAFLIVILAVLVPISKMTYYELKKNLKNSKRR